MKQIFPLLLPVILVLGIMSCAEREAPPAIALEDLNARTLWKHMNQDEPYAEYSFWPENVGLVKGNAPHGEFIKTFVNDRALKPKGPHFPDGSVIVKENYTADSTLAKLTVMYKAKGYNPEGGDWFWAVYEPDGAVKAEGKVQSCIGCHTVRKDKDFVFLYTIEGTGE
jgi:hypothetical protein